MKKALFILVCFLCVHAAHAQYTTAGKIQYERKLNVYATLIADGDRDWLESIKATTPQFKVTLFDMSFNSTMSIYKPEGDEEPANIWSPGEGPAKRNTVVCDYPHNHVKAIKQVYEQKFLVQDTLRKIAWKEKEEIRTIADYKCHKAVGIICDSVYVVAFYTEDIPVSGGPEMFGGLPGMILELAIPRLHTTWTATKVELTPPVATDFEIPEKGKKVTEKELYETIQNSLKDWGKWGTKYIWWTVL